MSGREQGGGAGGTRKIARGYEPLRGDLDGDHKLTPADAAIALWIAVGNVASLDALLMRQAAAGSIEIG